MTFTQGKIEDLSQEELSRLVLDMFHRIVVHYGLWFTEVRHQMGLDAALKALGAASERSVEIQLKRLSRQLGFRMQNGVPEPLLKMSKDSLLALLDSVSVNWLANDGVWFQAVEFDHGMNDAKRCNDSCWAHFSPFEAWSIKRLLDLPSQPGLGGLKKALQYRLYARINTQSFIEEGSGQSRISDERLPRAVGTQAQGARGLSLQNRRSGGVCLLCPNDRPADFDGLYQLSTRFSSGRLFLRLALYAGG